MARSSTRSIGAGRFLLIVAMLLCLVTGIAAAVSHHHALDAQTSLDSHCDLCDLSACLVAVFALPLAIAGLVFERMASKPAQTRRFCHLAFRPTCIRPPPAL